MLANYHTHTTFCDGSASPEEMVVSAIEEGFDAIGFSGHGYTPFDLRYCMKDTEKYCAEIGALKECYKDKIQIYLGVEEDAYSYVDRSKFDYIIGSCHYFCVDGVYYPIDSSYDHFKTCLTTFQNDILALSNAYYSYFCDYIVSRKPDIIGHFDLITKYDEMDEQRFLNNPAYLKLSEEFLQKAIGAEILFEVNTGAIFRGYRSTPYPYTNLLHLIKKHRGNVILSSDSHKPEALSHGFSEARKMLKDIGFTYVYVLYDNQFQKDTL